VSSSNSQIELWGPGVNERKTVGNCSGVMSISKSLHCDLPISNGFQSMHACTSGYDCDCFLDLSLSYAEAHVAALDARLGPRISKGPK